MKAAGRLLLLLALTIGVAGADPAASQRPKIGLVLEGGGARGCAHVGVLALLEELRIPIDCIAGTSMGAIVGGLYASGLSPAEIERQFATTDWDDLFTDTPPRRERSYRRKEDDGRFLKDMQFGLKRGRVILPTGFITGQKLDFLLGSLTMESASFDSLRLPFRAVATDIVTGETVALDHGDLIDALRASMSVPGVFSPVEIDGRMLVDGALTANLPVDIARGMGADVVIAVDIGEPLSGRGGMTSAIGVSKQVIALLTRSNVEPQLPGADLVIRPNLDGFGGRSFARAQEMMRRGMEATRLHEDFLRALAVGPDEYDAYLARIRRGSPRAIPIDYVRVGRPSRVDPRRVEGRLRAKPGRPLDLDLLKSDLTRAYDIGEFERVEFRLGGEKGRSGLLVRTKDKSWGPDYVRFGINFLDDLTGHGYYNLLANYTRTCLDPRGGEFRVDLQTGRTQRAFAEIYQPLDFKEFLFVAPFFEGRSSLRDLFRDGRQMAEYRTISLLGGADLGARFGALGEARVGGRWGRSEAEVSSGSGDFPEYDIHHGDITARLVVDQVDNANFPRDGFYGRTDLSVARESIGAAADYGKLSGSLAFYQCLGKSTVFIAGSGGTSLGTSLPLYDRFLLGGPPGLLGYREGELSGEYFGTARIGFQRRGGRAIPVIGSYIYFLAWAEAGNVWEERSEIRIGHLRYSGALALGADTILGPFRFAHARADGGRGRFPT